MLDGKVAAVTGAAGGIGEAIATRFAAEGAKVVIGDIQDDLGRATAARIGEAAAYRHCDVTREDDVAGLVAEAVARFGRLDVMCNNAGALGARGSILELTEADFDSTVALLLKGVFFGMKHAGRVMAEQGSGSILSTASIAAHRPGDGPHLYGTAKAAVVHLTQRVALELGERNVRVNAICPGGVVTPLVLGLLGGAASKEQVEEFMAVMQPIPRAGSVDDIAAAAAWLASDDAAYVTGQALSVDGGESVGPKWSTQAVK